MPANIFAELPATALEHEVFSELLVQPGLTIERIVSTGQASPPDFWYDQADDEWVLLLSGEAMLRLEEEVEARHLSAGDYLHLPAHCRHRIDWTHPDQPTIWLAVHYRNNNNFKADETSLSLLP